MENVLQDSLISSSDVCACFFFSAAKVHQQLVGIKNKVKKFQKELRDVKPSPECESTLVIYVYMTCPCFYIQVHLIQIIICLV